MKNVAELKERIEKNKDNHLKNFWCIGGREAGGESLRAHFGLNEENNLHALSWGHKATLSTEYKLAPKWSGDYEDGYYYLPKSFFIPYGITIDEQIALAKSFIGKTVQSNPKGETRGVAVSYSVIYDLEKYYANHELESHDAVQKVFDRDGFVVLLEWYDPDNTFCGNSVLNVIECPKEEIVKLNDNYQAVVSKDTIKVGCQTFPVSILDELKEAHKKLQ